MVRQIEKVVGAPIERWRLPDFDYGAFTPESQFPQARSTSSSLRDRSARARGEAGVTASAERYPQEVGNAELQEPHRFLAIDHLEPF